jgi:hypothetical protein
LARCETRYGYTPCTLLKSLLTTLQLLTWLHHYRIISTTTTTHTRLTSLSCPIQLWVRIIIQPFMMSRR